MRLTRVRDAQESRDSAIRSSVTTNLGSSIPRCRPGQGVRSSRHAWLSMRNRVAPLAKSSTWDLRPGRDEGLPDEGAHLGERRPVAAVIVKELVKAAGRQRAGRADAAGAVEHHPVDEVGPVERQAQGGAAAIRVANEVSALDVEGIEEAAHGIRQVPKGSLWLRSLLERP